MVSTNSSCDHVNKQLADLSVTSSGVQGSSARPLGLAGRSMTDSDKLSYQQHQITSMDQYGSDSEEALFVFASDAAHVTTHRDLDASNNDSAINLLIMDADECAPCGSNAVGELFFNRYF